jgi:hypothetical protein
VNCDLSGLTTTTLKTNGVTAFAGLTWVAQTPGTTLNFTNGLPVGFGFRSDAALGASATSTLRGPQLDNFLVEISGVAALPPVLTVDSAGGGSLQITWNAPAYVLQAATNLTESWLDVTPSPASPFTVVPSNAAGFYRLRQSP